MVGRFYGPFKMDSSKSCNDGDVVAALAVLTERVNTLVSDTEEMDKSVKERLTKLERLMHKVTAYATCASVIAPALVSFYLWVDQRQPQFQPNEIMVLKEEVQLLLKHRANGGVGAHWVSPMKKESIEPANEVLKTDEDLELFKQFKALQKTNAD
jgi:hypothetical protein